MEIDSEVVINIMRDESDTEDITLTLIKECKGLASKFG